MIKMHRYFQLHYAITRTNADSIALYRYTHECDAHACFTLHGIDDTFSYWGVFYCVKQISLNE